MNPFLPGQSGPDRNIFRERAEALLAARLRRASVFPDLVEAFDSPCWDLLLAIFVAGERNDLLSVSQATDMVLAPRTTALRHLTLLEQFGYILKIPDASDGRRLHLRLTDKAVTLMLRYLEEITADEIRAPASPD